jgi:diguanylate cyclase (GGDEF)-like protein
VGKRSWKILLVGDDLDEIQLIEEAFAEIQENQFSHEWIHPCELYLAARISDATTELGAESFDAVLLDLAGGEAHATAALTRFQEQAPGIPVVLLCAPNEEGEAVRLVRKGAQDYLLKTELDCAPLAKALSCAIERQRLSCASASSAFLDPLTGAYTETGFHRTGALLLKLMQRVGRGARAYVVEFENMARMRNIFGNEERDMAVILTTDFLRCHFDDCSIVGRFGGGRFAVLTADDGVSDPMSDAHRIQARIRRAGIGVRSGWPLVARVGVAAATAGSETVEQLLIAAMESLCENKRSASHAAVGG